MGAKFSADARDAQLLVRDKHGKLIIYKDRMDNTSCSKLPLPMNSFISGKKEQEIQYLFFPSSNYNGKNMHAHTFYDHDCDTPANDVVQPEKNVLGKKNVNHIKQSETSNSSYFEFNEFPVNMPLYPKFTTLENGIDMPRYTKRSAYKNCTVIPYPVVKDKEVTAAHNTVPMKFYTDDKCVNEYVNTLEDPKSYEKKHNVDNRITPINDQSFNVKYTNVKSFIDVAEKTNATHYRTFYEKYP